MISVICLFFLFSVLSTAVAQSLGFTYLSHDTKTIVIGAVYILFILASVAFCVLKKRKERLDADLGAKLALASGALLRCGYVLMSGLYERQHDVGVYTGMATEYANPGHIGYIEYICKFGKLPQMNPYDLFGYYHPPLHHVLEALWLRLNLLLGVKEELAFENLQILPLLYSCLFIYVTYRILKILKIDGKGLVLGTCFVTFHPSTIVMAGSVNNDMLTLLFMSLTIYTTLIFIREKNLKNLCFIALCIGFGMISKLNSVILALPVGIVFLMHFVGIIGMGHADVNVENDSERENERKTNSLSTWIRNYAIFALISIPIGLSWILRNMIRFHVRPGISDPGPDSPMLISGYSLWERIGIPSLSQWHFDFPFHSLNGKVCGNIWAIMYHTALYAEEYPADLSLWMLNICRVTFVLGVILSVITVVLLVRSLLDKRTLSEDRVFLIVGYFTAIAAFIVFALKYPYTCSSDFRYVAISLIYSAVGIGLTNKYKYRFIKIFNGALALFLGLITFIYLFWGRW